MWHELYLYSSCHIDFADCSSMYYMAQRSVIHTSASMSVPFFKYVYQSSQMIPLFENFDTCMMTMIVYMPALDLPRIFLHSVIYTPHRVTPSEFRHNIWYIIISAKWTKWMAEIMRSFDVCLFVCVHVRSDRSWELNANSSKTVKATGFKFDTRIHRHSTDATPKNFIQKGAWPRSRDLLNFWA